MTGKTKPAARKKSSQRKKLPIARLEELIEEATVDANSESEQASGFFTMFEDHLALPFKTEVLGVEATVEGIDMTDDEQIVAVCARGKSRQRIPITELPLPAQPPKGAEWIEAYRRWRVGSSR
ncbi:MAG TPA: calcium-binding protein [Anaeromyxobacteraceae bacterium]|nr:calcium-binding protein [Anaeromyxobacteraceae bacterium]